MWLPQIPSSSSHWSLHNSRPGTPVRAAERWGQNDGRKELVCESVFIVLQLLLRTMGANFWRMKGFCGVVSRPMGPARWGFACWKMRRPARSDLPDHTNPKCERGCRSTSSSFTLRVGVGQATLALTLQRDFRRVPMDPRHNHRCSREREERQEAERTRQQEEAQHSDYRDDERSATG